MNYNTRTGRAFMSYDPFSDERIDPPEPSDLFRYPELPSIIHDAVARAKKLIESLSSKDFEFYVGSLDTMISDGGIIAICKELDEVSDKQYLVSDDPDCLRAYVLSVEHDHPPELGPQLLGIFALSKAGQIVNILWPSNAIVASTFSERAFIDVFSEKINPDDEVRRFAVEAVQAVGFGEVIQKELKLKAELKGRKKDAAKAGHKMANDLKDRFVVQYLSNKASGVKETCSHAARMFFRSLSHEERALIVRGEDLISEDAIELAKRTLTRAVAVEKERNKKK